MNIPKLRARILEYDGSQEKLAEAMGISRSRLSAKINRWNGAQFSVAEQCFLVQRYGLSEEEAKEIFLA